jgi:hypothetical protein
MDHSKGAREPERRRGSPTRVIEQRTMSKPSKELHRWRISRIRATPAEFIGYVEAPDEEQAIKEAIKQFEIKGAEKQKRLVAGRVK